MFAILYFKNLEMTQWKTLILGIPKFLLDSLRIRIWNFWANFENAWVASICVGVFELKLNIWPMNQRSELYIWPRTTIYISVYRMLSEWWWKIGSYTLDVYVSESFSSTFRIFTNILSFHKHAVSTNIFHQHWITLTERVLRGNPERSIASACMCFCALDFSKKRVRWRS